MFNIFDLFIFSFTLTINHLQIWNLKESKAGNYKTPYACMCAAYQVLTYLKNNRRGDFPDQFVALMQKGINISLVVCLLTQWDIEPVG